MKIALFIPCYINALYPQVGEASYRLLRSLGLDVDYPLDQTCCGQPMANAGYERDAQPLAERMEELFAGYDYVVGPSASCVSFVREGYPRLVPHAVGPVGELDCGDAALGQRPAPEGCLALEELALLFERELADDVRVLHACPFAPVLRL